jgi:hypothetical protein
MSRLYDSKLFDLLAPEATKNKEMVEPPLPPGLVTSFLGRLSLLHGVPFAYLVADEHLLPPESLKFFRIDPQWINALVGGALSVGRSEDIRLLLNKTQAGNYIADLVEEARALRDEQRGGSRSQPAGGTGSPAPEPGFAFSGFFLRSRILQAWPGVEVRAFRSAGREVADELAMLRLDRVAPDILFALAAGTVREIEITQPPEGLHFVVQDGQQPSYRGNDQMRVLDIKAFAGNAASSAKFAEKQMSGPLRFVFKIGG